MTSERPAPPPTTPSETLTTEQLASAASKPETTAEPRSFDPARTNGSEPHAPIFPEAEADELRRAWSGIQAGFVDEPRRATEDADHLVASAIKRLAEMFAQERSSLEAQWSRGDEVSTEDLRLALQRYRAFFGRLLSF